MNTSLILSLNGMFKGTSNLNIFYTKKWMWMIGQTYISIT